MLQWTHAAVRNLRAGDYGTNCSNINTKIVSHIKSRSCRSGLTRSPRFFRGVAGPELLDIRSIAIASSSSSCLSLLMSPGMLRTFANNASESDGVRCPHLCWLANIVFVTLITASPHLAPSGRGVLRGMLKFTEQERRSLWRILVRLEHPRTMLRKAMESEVRICAGWWIFASSHHLNWPLAAEMCVVLHVMLKFLKKKFVDDSGAHWTYANNCFGRRWSPRSAVGGGRWIFASSPQSSSHLFRPLGAKGCSVWSWDLLLKKKFVDNFGALRTYKNNRFRWRWRLRSAVFLVHEPLIHHLNHHRTSLGPWRPWCTPRDAEIYWRSSSAILSSCVPCLLIQLRWIAERCLCVGIGVEFLFLLRLWLHWAFEQCPICLCPLPILCSLVLSHFALFTNKGISPLYYLVADWEQLLFPVYSVFDLPQTRKVRGFIDVEAH